MKIVQAPPNVGDIRGSLPDARFDQPIDLIVIVINWLLILGGAIAVLSLVYSGVMYITAGGDSAKAESARKNITWTIIGIIFIFMAIILVRLVNDILNGNPI